METSGVLTGASRTLDGRKMILTFEVDSVDFNHIEEVRQYEKANIKVTKFRNKRSLDANNYFHLLVGKIADAQTPPISKIYCKNLLIGRYGQVEYIDDSPVMLKTQLPADKMLEQENLHCLPCGGKTEDNGLQTYFYKVYRGSHTYNSKEMSILIDGTVEEAKALGIPTETPDQIEKMKALWGVKHG